MKANCPGCNAEINISASDLPHCCNDYCEDVAMLREDTVLMGALKNYAEYDRDYLLEVLTTALEKEEE